MLSDYLGVSERDTHHPVGLRAPHRPVLVAFHSSSLFKPGQHQHQHDHHEHQHQQHDQLVLHDHPSSDQHDKKPGEHDNGGRPLFPNHPPKVGQRLGEWALLVQIISKLHLKVS